MATDRGKPGATLTPQQQKWFAAVKAGLEAETGRTLEEWVAIARTCPETRPRARLVWMKTQHGLGQNRAMQVLDAAFGGGPDWDEPAALLDALWTDAGGRAIYEAVAATIGGWEGVIVGPRKTFVGFSKAVQFAAVKPVKGGGAALGLPLPSDAHARLAPSKKEPWAERNTATLLLASAKEWDTTAIALARRCYEAGR
jgi:hypothetical protein